MGYVPLSFGNGDGNRDGMVLRAFERLAARIPGWTPNDGDPVTAVAETTANYAADVTEVAVDVGAAIYVFFGRSVLGIPSIPGTAAGMGAVATFSGEDVVRSVPAGTRVAHQTETQEYVFEVVTTATAESDQTSVPLELAAVEEGAGSNNVPASTSMTILDNVPYLSSIITSTESAGGVDPETDEVYADRLSEITGTLRTGVSNARDAAILARSVPGVHRALAVNGWKPSTAATGLPLQIGVVALTATGEDVAAPVKLALATYLSRDDIRTLNVQVEVGSPAYLDLAIVYSGVAEPGVDPEAVRSVTDEAVRRFLDPGNFSGGLEEPPTWRGATVVRYLDVVGVVQRVPGLASLTDLTINGARVDVTLGTIAALPSPFEVGGSTVTGTVSAS